MKKSSRTIVGRIDADALEFTAGEDAVLDLALVEADCIGTAAHVTMLADMPHTPPLFSAAQRDAIVGALVDIIRLHRSGRFRITTADQDVHLAVERVLTAGLGDLGKRVHTARSRNDQVAVDLRLYGKEQLLLTIEAMAGLCGELLTFARRHAHWPMVGRTHMRPAMPSSVGLWASAHAESLLEDAVAVRAAYVLNDRCPLGSAAGYGVPLPIDRARTSDLLGFPAMHHNVLYASNARGKNESVILSALAQVMITLSRFAEDLILYSAPEFGYFILPEALCTGSSIMPQKKNPDVLELMRAKARRVAGHAGTVTQMVMGLPCGYNRDLQETKPPLLDGLNTVGACIRVASRLVSGLRADRGKLEGAFTPEVFATDKALERVAGGMAFRDAYDWVKAHMGEWSAGDPSAAVAAKTHAGATGGLDFRAYAGRVRELRAFVRRERRGYESAVSRLLGVSYPDLT